MYSERISTVMLTLCVMVVGLNWEFLTLEFVRVIRHEHFPYYFNFSNIVAVENKTVFQEIPAFRHVQNEQISCVLLYFMTIT